MKVSLDVTADLYLYNYYILEYHDSIHYIGEDQFSEHSNIISVFKKNLEEGGTEPRIYINDLEIIGDELFVFFKNSQGGITTYQGNNIIKLDTNFDNLTEASTVASTFDPYMLRSFEDYFAFIENSTINIFDKNFQFINSLNFADLKNQEYDWNSYNNFLDFTIFKDNEILLLTASSDSTNDFKTLYLDRYDFNGNNLENTKVISEEFGYTWSSGGYVNVATSIGWKVAGITPNIDNTSFVIDFASPTGFRNSSGQWENGTAKVIAFDDNYSPVGNAYLSDEINEGEIINILNDLSDNDGLGAFTYKWFRNDELIANQNNNNLLLSQEDVGKTIHAELSYIDQSGHLENVSTTPSEIIKNVNNPVTGFVEIIGGHENYVYEKESLTATLDYVNDIDGFDENDVNYSWFVDDYDDDISFLIGVGKTFTPTELNVHRPVVGSVTETLVGRDLYLKRFLLMNMELKKRSIVKLYSFEFK